MLLLLAVLVGCANPEGRDVGDCDNGADDDGDGLFDCNDDGCDGAPACSGDTDSGTSDTDTATSRPVAVCGVTPTSVATGEHAMFQGGASYDPDGFPITRFIWALVGRPQDSSASLLPGDSVSDRDVVPDLQGDYVGRLTVKTDDGRSSAPCETTLSVLRGPDLWVELLWAHGGDDMDLHVLQPGGSPRTDGDCYFANCTASALHWGTYGTEDDPHLDLDDIATTGPENINIAAPYDGAYTVFVHDDPSPAYPDANDVTVTIYISGIQVWQETRSVVGEDTDTYFATINYPAHTVTPCSSGGC